MLEDDDPAVLYYHEEPSAWARERPPVGVVKSPLELAHAHDAGD